MVGDIGDRAAKSWGCPYPLCSFVSLSLFLIFFWYFASFPAGSWLCAALVILHGWKCFWPLPEPCTGPEPLSPSHQLFPANSSHGTPGCAALHPQPKMTKISLIYTEMLPLGFPVALARPAGAHPAWMWLWPLWWACTGGAHRVEGRRVRAFRDTHPRERWGCSRCFSRGCNALEKLFVLCRARGSARLQRLSELG